MARTIETTVYTFDELSDEAKANARDWYRAGGLYYDWWQSVYEDAQTCGKILGIALGQKPVQLANKSTRYDPAIWFSGFASQGDGACFNGSYAYAKGGAKAIRRHAPQDEWLHHIADGLQEVQKRHRYCLKAETCHSGHYYHSGCMQVDVTRADDGEVSVDTEETVTRLLRDFADWIYRQLNADYDYQMSDEAVDESIVANEYEFTIDGKREG